MNRKLPLYLLTLFLLGFTAGFGICSLMCPRPDGTPRGEALLEMLTNRLNLADPQINSVREILTRARDRFEALKGEVRPRFKAIQEEADTAIAALLDADQITSFQKFREELEARRMERRAERDREGGLGK